MNHLRMPDFITHMTFLQNPNWGWGPDRSDQPFGVIKSTVEESVIFRLHTVFGRPDSEMVAYANIFAAAPLLYEALMDIENDDNRIPEPIWAKRNAALRAAHGETVERTEERRYG